MTEQRYDLQYYSTFWKKDHLGPAILMILISLGLLIVLLLPYKGDWTAFGVLFKVATEGNLSGASLLTLGILVVVWMIIAYLPTGISILRGGAIEMILTDKELILTFPGGVVRKWRWADETFQLTIIDEESNPRKVGKGQIDDRVYFPRFPTTLLSEDAHDALVKTAQDHRLSVTKTKSWLNLRSWGFYGLNTVIYIRRSSTPASPTMDSPRSTV